MELQVKKDFGIDVTITAENVKIVESISETLYQLKEDGTKDFSKRLGYDVTDSCIKQFVSFMNDVAYYRERPFDSTSLIETLFDKLPEQKQNELWKTLNRKYDFEEQNTEA